jgi:hypothetical protein
MKIKALTLGFAVLVGIAGSQPARATTLTTYTDQTAFNEITTVATKNFVFLKSTIEIGGAANDYDYVAPTAQQTTAWFHRAIFWRD